ncbi:hypothetical protein ACWU4D_13090 [Vibrio sp. WJH972]
MKTYNSQSGHAALLFAMFIPLFFGVFALGSDGARALQSKARLNEALEVASLAVAAQDSDNNGTRVATAKAYIKYFFPNSHEISDSDINITKITCDEDSSSSECPNFDATTDTRYFKYTVTGSITEDTWFPGNDAIIGFGDDYDVTSASVAKKYQSQTVDIVYVADFSGSMSESLKSAVGDDVGLAKYEILVNIIELVNEEVKEFNDTIAGSVNTQSTVGLVAYNKVTHGVDVDGDECGVDSWLYTNPSGNINSLGSLDENATAAYSNVFDGGSECDGDNGPYIKGTFENIELTESFGESGSDFETTIQNFSPKGGTASTQGLIAAAKVAYLGTNTRKLLIILSDGVDNPAPPNEDIVYAGLCDTITSTLDAQTSSEGDSVISRIALIGFDYDTDTNQALSDCVGGDDSGNIFEASSGEELKSAILSLISEEIGHLAQ